MAVACLVHLTAALPHELVFTLSFKRLDTDDAALNHLPAHRRRVVDAWAGRTELPVAFSSSQIVQHVKTRYAHHQDGRGTRSSARRQCLRRDRLRHLREDESVVFELSGQRVVNGLKSEKADGGF